ncbi:MAG: hypothetical protein K9M55_02755 [Candidatus Marinimicrobia bacterium]|nr:hypothetical protein [Candidatus Neomarinimicrobiota bacterium]MCF7921600.1 hypothetical protein [Candidatus Neomarinimicrobiota bacterium]
MGGKLCPKIILEGTRLTGKTDLAFALNEHPRIVGPRKYRYHSPLISAEWCAFTNFPWGRGLINFEAQEETQALETYRTWLKLFQLQKYYSWIVDRFHISTLLYQREVYNRNYDFAWLEEGLQELGFHLVLCFRSDESFEAARAARLEISGNPAQYDNLDVFRREQEQFITLVRQSRLPLLELNVSERPLDLLAQDVADWLESTGGLYAD